MQKRLYNFCIYIAFGLYRFFGLFSKRSRAFFTSRRTYQQIPKMKESILFHCASLGEYEESKPLIDEISKQFSGIPIMISFFSNSGFEQLKKRERNENIVYLPLDAFGAYESFLDRLNPRIVFISKYEFWAGFYDALNNRKIPILHFNTTISKKSSILRWPLSIFLPLFRTMKAYTTNQESADILESNGFQDVTVGVDLRLNRAINLPNEAPRYERLNESIDKPVIVFGSTWEADEELIVPFIQSHPEFQYILAPHELDSKHLASLKEPLKNAQLWSEWNGDAWNCMLIDTIGDLKYLYQYATIAYVGGGQHHKVHNFLEASAYLIPTVIGPKHRNMPVANTMIKNGFTECVSNYEEFEHSLLSKRFSDSQKDELYSLFKESQNTLELIVNRTKNLLEG